MTHSPLSYEAVVDAIHTLESNGRPVGARSVHDVLKTGSMTTIQKHLVRWREEKARVVPSDLPGSLQREILSFVTSEVKKAQNHLEGLLEEGRAALDEALRTGDELEQRLTVQEQESEARTLRIAEQADQIRHLEIRQAECQERETREREEAHSLREELARATLRLEELPRIRKSLEELTQKLDQEKEARTAAEKDSAVSRALLAEKASSHKPTGRA